jgi:hypothetical protein
MKKKLKVEEVQELPENEEFVSDDDIDIEVTMDEEDNSVYVRFSGFADSEDAEEYAEMLANTLPLLLFESTRLQ